MIVRFPPALTVLAALTFLLQLPGVLFAQTSDGPARPNVVFILADDAGFGDVGVYGAEKFATPHLDQLASEGMRFTDAHSPSAVCSPTRYSLLTGRYGFRTYTRGDAIQSNDPLLVKPGQMTVADVFKEAGYRTGIVGKWHLGFGREGAPGFDPHAGIDWNGPVKPGPLETGFDYFFGVPMVGQLPHLYIENHHVVNREALNESIEFLGDAKNPGEPLTWRERYEKPLQRGEWFEWAHTEPIAYAHEDLAVRITEEAVDFIDRQDPEQPFFLYFPHRSPHVPWTPHPRFEGGTDFQQDRNQRYGEMMIELDWSVGRIMEALERKGLADDTLVIFSSDNGGALYYWNVDYADGEGHFVNGPFRGQKTEVYEGGHRVPFIARWPGVVEPGSVNDGLIANTDFFATVAELLGVEIPPGQAPDSLSFLPLLTGEREESSRDTLIMDSPGGLIAIRHHEWKYIPAQGGGGFNWMPYRVDTSLPPAQLFNLEMDERESRNLFFQHPAVAARLHGMLMELTRERDEFSDYVANGEE